MEVNQSGLRKRISYGNFCLFFLLLSCATPFVYDPEGYFQFRVPKFLFFSLVVIVQSVVVFVKRKHCLSVQYNALTWAYSSFFLAVVIAQWSAHDPFMSLHSTFERMEGFWFYVTLFLFFCLCSIFLPSGQGWKLIFWGWIGVAVLVCGFGFVLGATSVEQQRMASTLGNASYLAHYLLSSLLLLFLFDPPFRSHAAPYWLLAIVLLLLAGIFYTFSRTTYAGLVLGGLVYGLIQYSGGQPPIKSVSFRSIRWLAPLVMLGAFLLIRYQEMLLYLVRTPGSLLDRLRLWQIALMGIRERPWTGWGTDNFTYVYEKYSRWFSFPQTFWYDRSHNVFLEWFVNGGLPAGLSYGSIWVLLLWYIWKASLPRRQKAILTAWWLVSVQYLLLNIDNLPNWILLLLVSLYTMSNQPAGRVGHLRNRKGISLLCFLLLAGGISLFSLSFWKTAYAYMLAREYALHPQSGDRLRLLDRLDALGSAANYNLVKPASDHVYAVLTSDESGMVPKEYGESVLRFIENEIRKRPPSLLLLHKKAGVESTLSDSRKAIQTYKAAIKLNPRFLPAYMRIGYEYTQQKDYRVASAYFDRAAKIAADSTEASLMKLKILAMTQPEYVVEKALSAFPAGNLILHSHLVRELFADTRTLAGYLAWIEQGGFSHSTHPTHKGYHEWIMCAYELGNLEAMEQALQAYERSYPCLPNITARLMKLVREGGHPYLKLREFRTFCGN